MLLLGSIVSGNPGAGVALLDSSVARFNSDGGTVNRITGHLFNGVVVGDLSFARFVGGGNDVVTGNSGTDVICFPQFPATRGALTNIGGGTTNCIEP